MAAKAGAGNPGTAPAEESSLAGGFNSAIKHIIHHRVGLELAARERPEAALKNFEVALALVPTYAEAWLHRGMILRQLGTLDQAYDSFAQAAILTPLYTAALENLASVGPAIGRPKSILTPWPARPAPNAVARVWHKVRGAVRIREPICYLPTDKPTEEAVRANLAADPTSASDAVTLGRIIGMDRRTEATCFFRYAHALAPWAGDPVLYLGTALGVGPDRIDEIKEAARTALRAGGTDRRLAPTALWQSLYLAEWKDYDRLYAATIESLEHEPASVPAFAALHLTEDVSLHAACAQAYHRVRAEPLAPLQRTARPPAEKRLTLGYLSADYRDHPGARLFTELFEIHDRARYRVFGFSTFRGEDSDIGQRVRASFDKIVDLDNLSDQGAAQEIATHGVDILIDVTGNAFNAQVTVLAARPAPIQVNYLAFPGPSGSTGIDYAVVDSTVVTPDQEKHYREALVFMPGCYQVNDRKRKIAGTTGSRAAYGLPPSGAVFCCFNEPRKITPEVFSIWMRILLRSPGSVLWLYTMHPMTIANLRREASARGVDPERLVFAGRIANDAHLARYRLADLFLDTAPYGAHTTASDALWGGCPVVTVLGKAFPGRVTASLLKAVNLPELITGSWQEYEDLAVKIAADPAAAARLRGHLEAGRGGFSLFDTPAFARHLERAYEYMWRRHVSGAAPGRFSVADL